MSAWIEPPPTRQRGMGCLAKGCLILACFAIFLLIACAVGLYFGLRSDSAVVRSAILAGKTRAVATEPSPIPKYETTDQNVEASKRKWDDFQTATESNRPAGIELTASDLNNLIARNRHLQGKVFASIDGNRLRIQTSVPVGEYVGTSGYYLNGDIVVESNGPQSLGQPQLSNVTINGQAVPSDLLNWKYRGRSLRDYISEYRSNEPMGTIEIRDGKLIIEKSR